MGDIWYEIIYIIGNMRGMVYVCGVTYGYRVIYRYGRYMSMGEIWIWVIHQFQWYAWYICMGNILIQVIYGGGDIWVYYIGINILYGYIIQVDIQVYWYMGILYGYWYTGILYGYWYMGILYGYWYAGILYRYIIQILMYGYVHYTNIDDIWQVRHCMGWI